MIFDERFFYDSFNEAVLVANGNLTPIDLCALRLGGMGIPLWNVFHQSTLLIPSRSTFHFCSDGCRCWYGYTLSCLAIMVSFPTIAVGTRARTGLLRNSGLRCHGCVLSRLFAIELVLRISTVLR